ncbi:MAG TPA: alpha/beta fold hydrolase [Burkholderiales bacterium]|nr:alpha/beta fold hydrolase [Burkholderiales bacterium]
MVARILAALLAVELALYALFGLWLSSNAGLSPLSCVLLATAIALAVRAAVVATTFILAYLYRGQSQEGIGLGLPAILRIVGLEFLAFVALFTLLQPLERWALPRPSRSRTAQRATPALLVHGIYCNAAVWWWMRRRLKAHGVPSTFAIDVEPPFGSIDDFARQLAEHIDSVCAATGAARVVLIGHSMGGLVARACLQSFAGPGRIAKLITLGSPHHGSGLAYWGVGKAARQMRPGSLWLSALNRHESEPPRVPIVSVFTRHDNFVAPQDSPVLAQATNVPLARIGHLSLLFSGAVAKRLCEEIVAADSDVKAAHEL